MSIQFNARAIFAIGVRIEENGKAFYHEVAKGSADENMKTFFARLADWEDRHVELFQELQAALPEHAQDDALFDPDNDMMSYLQAAADGHVFVATADMAKFVAKHCQTPEQALDMALDFEKDLVVYYTTMKKMVGEHTGRENIDLLIDEELKHIALLNKKKGELAR